jgi:hypothetical protein
MAEAENRRNDKECLFQILRARHLSATPSDFNDLLSWARSKMEAEDIKLILQEFEEWKNS